MIGAQLQLDAVRVGYGGKPVVTDVSFRLARGEIGCLLGGSGSGKTTLLRAIAGFEPVMGGEIRLAGRVVSSAGQAVPAHRRGVGMVFQDHALFPHLSVADNVGFGLRALTRAERARRVDELLALVGLAEYAHAWPHELSGGQQQRVALARALAPRPALVLLDEPFANLDVGLRERLSYEVRELLKNSESTALLVTHDQHEAFAMADTVGVLADGRLQQWARPYELYHEPVNRRVAEFIGEGVFLTGRVRADGCLTLELGEVVCPRERDLPVGAEVDVLIRPDDVVHDDHSPVTAVVRARAFRGAQFLYTLELASGARVQSLVPSHHDHRLGEAIGIRLELDHVIAFPRGGEGAHQPAPAECSVPTYRL